MIPKGSCRRQPLKPWIRPELIKPMDLKRIFFKDLSTRPYGTPSGLPSAILIDSYLQILDQRLLQAPRTSLRHNP